MVALATALSTDSRAYTTNGARWIGTPVPYVVNTANLRSAGQRHRAGRAGWR